MRAPYRTKANTSHWYTGTAPAGLNRALCGRIEWQNDLKPAPKTEPRCLRCTKAKK
jgi:hypothetical protein